MQSILAVKCIVLPVLQALTSKAVDAHLQVRLMHEHGYELGNLDATIILQRPKLSPHKERIRENLCQLLDAHPSTINIKVQPATCIA